MNAHPTVDETPEFSRRQAPHYRPVARPSAEDTTGTDAMGRIPDPSIPDFGAEWDQEWEKSLFTHALERVSQQIDERQFQVFDCYVTKDWPAGRVAKMLGVSVARVYLTKHRVAALLKKEVKRLEKDILKSLRQNEPSSNSR